MDSLRQTVAKVALFNMGFIPLVGSTCAFGAALL